MNKKYLILIAFLFVFTNCLYAGFFNKNKWAEFNENGYRIKYIKTSKIKPLKIEEKDGFVYVTLNTDKEVSIGIQQCVHRYLNTVIIGASPIETFVKNKKSYLKIPMFVKSHRYELMVNGIHFKIYKKKK